MRIYISWMRKGLRGSAISVRWSPKALFIIGA